MKIGVQRYNLFSILQVIVCQKNRNESFYVEVYSKPYSCFKKADNPPFFHHENCGVAPFFQQESIFVFFIPFLLLNLHLNILLMQDYIVSARKYRPSTFHSVVGQDVIVRTLKNAIKNNLLAQAFLFTGPRGVGKTTCARIFAKTINCENLNAEGEACNECPSCLSFNQNSSFNIHELDAASNNKVDDIRSLIEQVRVPPHEGKYKVYIIDEVHMLTDQAFNAFLKTLEEPPAYAKFILATTERHKILPTILSRCQIYNFKRIGVEDIAKHLAWVALQENVEADPDALHIIAQKADGALRDALSIFDQLVTFGGRKITYASAIENLNVLDFDYYFRFLDLIIAGDYPALLLTLNEIIENGFDGSHILAGLANHLRNLFVAVNENTLKLLEVGEGLKARYMTQAQACPSGFVIDALKFLSEADLRYNASNHKRLMLETTLLKLAKRTAFEEESSDDSQKKKVADKNKNTVKTNDSSEMPAVSDKVVDYQSISYSIKEKKDEIIQLRNVEKRDTPFTIDEVKQVWFAYIEMIRDERITLSSIMKKAQLKINGAHSIIVTMPAELDKVEIEKNAPAILTFMHDKLINDYIEFVVEFSKDESSRKTSTADEALQVMLDQNPVLAQFVSYFELKAKQ